MNTFKWLPTVLILVLFCAENLLAQQVTAMYNEDKSEIIIQNNRREVIYLFRRDIPIAIDGTKCFDNYNVVVTSKELILFSCLDTKGNFAKVLPGQKDVFKVKNKCAITQLYYYPCIDNIVNQPALAQIALPVKEEQVVEKTTSKTQPLAQPGIKGVLKPSVVPKTDSISVPKVEVKPKKEEKQILRAEPEKRAEMTQEELFDKISKEYQQLSAACMPLLKKEIDMKPVDKKTLDGKQRSLKNLKERAEKIVPIDATHTKIKENVISQLTSLIEHIAEVTIVGAKTIKEDYQEIYIKHSSRIAGLLEQDTKIEAIVNAKIKEFVLTRWIDKESIYSVINSLSEGVVYSEKEFESDRIQFVGKWKKEDREKLENLLIRQNDELKDGYNKLKYNASIYKNRIDDLQPPYAMLIFLSIVLLLVVIALIFYIRAYYRSKKIEEYDSKMMQDSIRSIDVEKEQPLYFETGLDEVRDEAERGEYYIIDMGTIFNDTAIEKVYISKNCILDIYRFFMEFLKLKGKTNETGCFVIGRWEEVSPNTYNISLEEIIEPGNDAIYGEYELDFGTQIGIGLESAIINMRQLTQKEYVQTSWIHSHPGLGLFLSNHDLSVQSQLVYSDHPTRMLAIVIDSNTENLDTAFFTAKQSGEMNNKEELKKVLSFEKIARWAKGIQIEEEPEIVGEIVEKMIEEPIDFTNYYEYTSDSPNAAINTFLFSGSAIIDMDYMVSPNVEGLQGYFYGRTLNNPERWMILENYRATKTEDNDKPVGCLLVLPQFTYQSVLVRYESIIDSYDFFVVYNPRQDDLKIITRSGNGKYLIGAERDLHPLPMMELRKWTRRRRD